MVRSHPNEFALFDVRAGDAHLEGYRVEVDLGYADGEVGPHLGGGGGSRVGGVDDLPEGGAPDEIVGLEEIVGVP